MSKGNLLEKDISKKLNERVKELSCLYDISRAARKHNVSLENLLAEVVDIIPRGWQYPAKAQAFIVLDKQTYGHVQRTKTAQIVKIKISGIERGSLVVHYPEEFKRKGFKAFLPEEQHLIEQIASELSLIIESYERREKEKSMEARIRFSDRLNILGEFTAGIAHELNTPLGNILGYAQLLFEDEGNRNKRNDLRKIINSSVQAREIVKKLMFFSCEMPTQFMKADLNRLIRENMDLIRIQLREGKTKVELRLAESLPKIRVDALQFSQLLFNLVLNALYAMPAGGKIILTTEQIGRNVLLVVEDTGTGIDERDLVKIFEPFYSTKPTGEGTGLGLSVVHGIVKAHGGEINVRSTKGEGTVFTIKFKKIGRDV